MCTQGNTDANNSKKTQWWKEAISELPCVSVSKRILMQNLLYENELIHGNEPLGRTHFHINGFPQKLVLTQRHEPMWKRPISLKQ